MFLYVEIFDRIVHFFVLPVPIFNYTGTRFYSRYVPFRFSQLQEFKENKLSAEQLAELYVADRFSSDGKKAKYDCVKPFVRSF